MSLARIVVSASPGEIRVAALLGDRLVDYAIGRPGAPDLVGDLYRGRIVARVPAMAGAFVALGVAEGFLPDSAGAKGRGVGDAVLVRVVRAAQGGKGPRLGAVSAAEAAGLAASGPPERLRPGPSVVERMAALFPDAPVEIGDPALLATLRPVLGGRAMAVPAGFDDALETEIDALGTPEVALAGGGALRIHPVPALTAIDMDAGGASAARGSKLHAQLGLNLGAIPELARQIRLRNLGGAILVDWAGLPIGKRARLGPALAAALAEDPAGPRLVGFTGLGLAEILRPRVGAPLHEVLAGPHAAGLAGLRAAAREVAARPGWVPRLVAAPAVVAALVADAGALAAFARIAGRAVVLVGDARVTRWEVG
jgi:Ribonuclease G/E